MRAALALAVLLFTTACDSAVQLAPASSNQEGKRFDVPATGKTALYVFTTSKAGTTWNIAVDQRQIGQLESGQWMRVDLTPGQQDVRCSSAILKDPPARLSVPAQAGSVNYVMASYVPLGNPSCKLQAVASAVAQREIATGTRSQEFGGASD